MLHQGIHRRGPEAKLDSPRVALNCHVPPVSAAVTILFPSSVVTAEFEVGEWVS